MRKKTALKASTGTVVNVYIDERTKAFLEKISQEEHRSLSAQIRMIIEQWLQKGES